MSGFWAGYFASRAAPLGRVKAGPVTAAFYNFHPGMVARAVPGCWEAVQPEQMVLRRAAAAAAALRSHSAPDALEALSAARPSLRGVVLDRAGDGRMLASANQRLCADLENRLVDIGLDRPLAVLGEVWQAVTALREHRGDGHVAALVSHGVSGLEAHVLVAATQGTEPAGLRDNRGWSQEEWADAAERLARRGLLEPDGTPTSAGKELHRSIEGLTDWLAEAPWAGLGGDERTALYGVLRACAADIQSSGLYPFPNPMGLPRLA